MLRARLAKRLQSSVTYTRKGEQPDVAPKVVKQVSKTAQGVTVITSDNSGPVSTVAVYMSQGSRSDTPTTPGVAHVFKSSLIRNVEGDTVTRTILDAELRGNSLYSSVGREHVLLASEFLRDDVVDVVPTLVQNVFNTKFEPYEFIDATEKTFEQSVVALSDPKTVVLDKLHQVAFRNGLGNPFFPSGEALKSLSRKTIKDFAAQLSADKIAVVGTGINHTDLKNLVEEALATVKLPSGKSEKTPSKYYGGEARVDAGPNSEAIYAVAYPGASIASADYYAALVLKELLDGAARVKWGTPSVGTDSTSVEAFNASYSDSGLVGFIVKGKAEEVKQVAQQTISSLKQAAVGLPAEQLEAAKKVAIVSLESQLNRQALVEALGAEVTLNANTASVEALSKVTAADVQKIAKSALQSKPSVAAYGNTLQLPYADEL